MRMSPFLARAGLMACILPFAVGCEPNYATSFKLMPGGRATITAHGDQAVALVRNQGPGSVHAEFTDGGAGPATREISANACMRELMKWRQLTLLGIEGESNVELEVYSASGFAMNLLPNTPPAKP